MRSVPSLDTRVIILVLPTSQAHYKGQKWWCIIVCDELSKGKIYEHKHSAMDCGDINISEN